MFLFSLLGCGARTSTVKQSRLDYCRKFELLKAVYGIHCLWHTLFINIVIIIKYVG